MQYISGWTYQHNSQKFNIGQLRDDKVKSNLEQSDGTFLDYARSCDCVLARAHACKNDPTIISGHIGEYGNMTRQ
jgi:hypothetical protein